MGHGALIGLILVLAWIQPAPDPRPSPAPPATSVNMRQLSPEAWAQNRGETLPVPSSAPTTPPKRVSENTPPEKKKREPEEHPKGQVVDTAPGNDEVAPDAKYLAESNNRVEKETRAKDQTQFYKNAQPRTTSPNPVAESQAGTGNSDSAQDEGNAGSGSDATPPREGQKKAAVEVPDVNKRDEIALRPLDLPDLPGPQLENQDESEAVQGNSDRLRLQPGGEDGEASASAGNAGGRINLVPNGAMLDKISGAAPNDHLGELEEGEGTFLNAREWKFASFFNRIKQGVSQNWSPDAKLRQRDPTGEIYGGRDRHTVVTVTLNQNGFVKEIWVEKSSGLDFLDLEAIASFERAQPFPNPPPGLLKDDSTVQFQFGFFVDMGAGRLRLFRRAN